MKAFPTPACIEVTGFKVIENTLYWTTDFNTGSYFAFCSAQQLTSIMAQLAKLAKKHGPAQTQNVLVNRIQKLATGKCSYYYYTSEELMAS